MKKTKIILIILLCVIAVFTGTFFVYVSNYYKADNYAINIMGKTEIYRDGNLTILLPNTPSGKGVIFYPGAKVEETAYLPLLEELRENGITCVLVKMPFHMAILNSGAANNIFEKLPEIKDWYIGGHSLGGAMASSYASKHQDKLGGLILLGAYIYGDIPVDKTVTIYGSNDHVLDKSKINYSKNIFVIEGGNHAQFGNYGEQKGDGEASITPDEQQKQTVEIILKFINN